MKENFIFRLRQEKGWTQSELARILSVSEKKLAKWENGVGFPNVKTFELLIRVSGKTVTEDVYKRQVLERLQRLCLSALREKYLLAVPQER